MKSRIVRRSLAVLLFALPALQAAAAPKPSSALDALKGLTSAAQRDAVAAATPAVTTPVLQ